MPKIIDVRGDGQPLLGRLRGVLARHEIRPVLRTADDDRLIYFEATDPHLVFRAPPPKPLPEMLTNAERQLVVRKKLADALVALGAKLKLVPVRLADRAGATVSDDYVLAAPQVVQDPFEGDDDGEGFGESIGGYLRGHLRFKKEPKGKLPAIFRIGYSLAIACNDAVAKKLEGTGAVLVGFKEYEDRLLPFPPASYEILRCGTEGAELRLVDDEPGSGDFEEGKPLARTWPAKAPFAKMHSAKSRKKIVDFTGCDGAPVITAKAKAVLERFDLDGVELLPVKLKDHGGKAVAGDHWVMHVTGTRAYVDVAESDIEVNHGLLWTARELVVDESAVANGPAFFRVPGARYPWVFVRNDVREAMVAAKLTGFRTEHPAEYAHTVEGGGIPHVS